MYLAPLNYDKYFRKVFSNVEITKRFLEDFLETKVNDLEMLKGRHRITEDDFLYIADEKEKWEQVERYERGVYEDAVKEARRQIEKKFKHAQKNKACEIARKLKDKGFDDEFISDVSGLSPAELILMEITPPPDQKK